MDGALNYNMSDIQINKTKRSISGIYFRYQNPDNQRWENWCFEDLPESKQKEILDTKTDSEWIKGLAISLANTLNRITEQFDITAENE
jgi:hypothetical protein